jgi:hypothetical protein
VFHALPRLFHVAHLSKRVFSCNYMKYTHQTNGSMDKTYGFILIESALCPMAKAISSDMLRLFQILLKLILSSF